MCAIVHVQLFREWHYVRTEKQARATVYILTRNTRVCIRECCCAAKNLGAAWERCQYTQVLENQLSWSFTMED